MNDVDRVLTAQLLVGWAGEGGEEPRLGWWRSDMVSEFGGEDLFQRLLPQTWRWGVLQAAREAAKRRDAELRLQDHNPDRILSLFHLGFELDEQVEERLAAHKNSGVMPGEALPVLENFVGKDWERARFEAWLREHGNEEYVTVPAGRRLKGDAPGEISVIVDRLLAAHVSLGDAYAMPHFRRAV